MLSGHLVYIGDHKDLYLNTFKNEIESFSRTQGIIVRLWEDKDIRQLIESKFSPNILDAYNTVIPYALKADLARLCILYEHGGIYSDIGIILTNKIDTNGYDLVLFRDHLIESMYDIPFAIQFSLMFSKPKNKIIYKTIETLANIYNNHEYGYNPMFPGGEIHLANAIMDNKNDKIYVGRFGDSSVDLEQFLLGKVAIGYEQDNVVALFKDVIKNKTLKNIDEYKTDYINAWFNRKLYNE